jgi:hypothetical protein
MRRLSRWFLRLFCWLGAHDWTGHVPCRDCGAPFPGPAYLDEWSRVRRRP